MTNASITGSVVLVEKNACNEHSKKRDLKAEEKDCIRSMRSEKTNKSKAKIGEYPCWELNCGKMFETADKRCIHKYKVHSEKGRAAT